jgi:hypothetical protein
VRRRISFESANLIGSPQGDGNGKIEVKNKINSSVEGTASSAPTLIVRGCEISLENILTN